MKKLTSYALAISAMTVASAPLTAPAFAYADGPDHYRVVNIKGNETLNLRARPGTYTRIIAHIPFNARRLGNAIRTQGKWTRIDYAGKRGWVHNDYLAEDAHAGPTIYKVVGLENWNSLNMRKKPNIGARIISDIPGSADFIEDCGACKGVWCPVRYNKVDGWVHKRFLAVVKYPRDNRYSSNESAPNRTEDFRNRYGNEYMGLGTGRRLTWREKWRNRKLNKRYNRNWFWNN